MLIKKEIKIHERIAIASASTVGFAVAFIRLQYSFSNPKLQRLDSF
jgi:hypothetical protein